ncbi:MAG: metallophosphoesterase family protein [Bacteroidetes bacterium]|nr:metallophosphoesterase family protein [Bacteroidota bacterium]
MTQVTHCMRIAVISDIHSNFHALERTFEVIDQLAVDQVFCLGDIVGYGPAPNECIALVRERCAVTVRGNHDSGAIDELPLDHFNSYGESAMRWTRKQLTEENAAFLRNLPFLHVQDSITLAHAAPLNPQSWRYIFAWPDAQRCFAAFSTPYCFIGHTHVPVVVGENGSVNRFQPGIRFLINVGSVGQARDGNPKASFGLLDTGKKTVDIVRLEYDIEGAAQAILKANLPDYLAHRLFMGI